MACRGSLELAKTNSNAIAAAKLANIWDLRGHEAGQEMGSGPGGFVGATSLNCEEGNMINLLDDSMLAPAIPAPTSLRGHNYYVSNPPTQQPPIQALHSNTSYVLLAILWLSTFDNSLERRTTVGKALPAHLATMALALTIATIGLLPFQQSPVI
jgi:hypothetical protein